MHSKVSADDPSNQMFGTCQLLEILQDGRFHSGEALGLVLGIGRGAVWKRIKKINSEFGVIVHSVPGRGYKIAQEMISLAPNQTFTGQDFAWNVIRHEAVDSTNAEVLRKLEAGFNAPFAVVAEMQTAGRGRRGRVWVSPFGENLYFTLALKIDQGLRQIEGLSLSVGLAVLKTLQVFGVRGAGLKWPNDVLVSDRKIAGVLLELVGDVADVCHVAIGIGINVNMVQSVDRIDQNWTSVNVELGARIDRNYLLAELQKQLDLHLAVHLKQGFAALRDEWDSQSLWRGRQVTLSAGPRSVTGLFKGVDCDGALMIQVGDETCFFSGGEISLRLDNDFRG